jgi:magnesium-transporting ATPase (P-type)
MDRPLPKTIRRTSVGIVWPTIVCAILHFMAAFFAFMLMFGNSMERFDSGRPPTAVEETIEDFGRMAVNILCFPATHIAKATEIHNNLAEWLLMISNSLLWGVALAAVFRIARRTYQTRQFGLRTLMIAMTVFAILLGLIAVLAKWMPKWPLAY